MCILFHTVSHPGYQLLVISSCIPCPMRLDDDADLPVVPVSWLPIETSTLIDRPSQRNGTPSPTSLVPLETMYPPMMGQISLGYCPVEISAIRLEEPGWE
jgi:hypothetical protein